MKKILFILLITFFSTSLFSTSLFSREITILPAYVVGEEPTALKKKDNLANGIAELIGYYANENFVVESSDPEKVKTYLSELGEEMDRKPSRSLLNGICEEFGSDFIIKPEINFADKISILSEVYNCRGKVIASDESLFADNFYFSMEKHTKKTLSFLVPKMKPIIKKDSTEEEEIIFLMDLSGSLTREIKSAISYILSITGSKNFSLGAILVKENSIKVIKPSFNHKQLKEELERAKTGGDFGLERVTQGLIKAKSELGISKLSKKKMIIITDAKSNQTSDYGYLSAVQSLRELGYNTFIITGSYFDYKSMNLHKKAAKSGGNDLKQITHYQTIGTKMGLRTIYLYDRNIYWDNSSQINFKEFDIKELSMFEEGRVLNIVDFPHPDNMSFVYEKISGLKLIERKEISSNIESVIEKLVQSNSGTLSYTGSKVLMKSGSISFWLLLKSYDESLEGSDVTFKATFVKDSFSPNGFANIPTETFLYRENIPKLLVLEPSQIRNFLKSNSSFTCFVSGKILEIK